MTIDMDKGLFDSDKSLFGNEFRFLAMVKTLEMPFFRHGFVFTAKFFVPDKFTGTSASGVFSTFSFGFTVVLREPSFKVCRIACIVASIGA